jgi:hypothetical protein
VICGRCRDDKPEDEFNRDGRSKTGRRSICSKCSQHADRRSLYNIDQTEYEALLAAQCGTCAICDDPFSDSNLPHIDHDHSCCPGRRSCGNCTRGLLCGRCNRAIGIFEDDVDLFDRAVSYLNRSYD